jgi:hypothetical protein
MHDFEPSKGDICGDPTGLRVRVEDVDIYDFRDRMSRNRDRCRMWLSFTAFLSSVICLRVLCQSRPNFSPRVVTS